MRGYEDNAQYAALDDSLCPIDSEAKKTLIEMGVHILKTDYFRNGNNIGPDALIGQTKAFVSLMDEFDFDVLVKVDCDTLVYDASWLWSIEASHDIASLVGTFKTIPYYVFGACYGIRKEWLEDLAKDAEQFRAWQGSFEDFETGVRLYRMSGGNLNYAVRYRVHEDDGFILCPLNAAREDMYKARYVNFGWDLQSVPRDKRPAYKQQQLEMMKRMNELRFRADAQPIEEN
jgi:hypothetical protein